MTDQTDGGGEEGRRSSAWAVTLDAAALAVLLAALIATEEEGDAVLLTDDAYRASAGEHGTGVGLWDATAARIAIEPSTREGRLAHRTWECRWRAAEGGYRVVLIADTAPVAAIGAERMADGYDAAHLDLIRVADDAPSQRLLLGRREGDGAFREGRVPSDLPYWTKRTGDRNKRLVLATVAYAASAAQPDDSTEIAFVRCAGLAEEGQ